MGLQLLSILSQVKAVACFDFHGGGAVDECLVQAGAGFTDQLLKVASAGRLYRGEYAPTGSKDPYVSFALQAHLKLSGAVTRP